MDLDAPETRTRADIQGIRGVAVLLVVLFHVDGWIRGGFIGVDVFFVVSGFVITGLLVRETRDAGSVPLGRFYARRVRRLMPLLALTLSVTALAGVVLLNPLGASDRTAKTAAGAAVLNANTYLERIADDYFGVPAKANALLHTWSLSVEEQFYLVFPFVVLAGLALGRRSGRRFARRTGVRLVAVLGLAGASWAGYLLLLEGGLDAVVRRFGFSGGPTVGFYSAPSRAWEFLAGAALAILAPAVRRLPVRAHEASGVVGLALVVVAAVTFTPATGRSALPMTIPVAGALLLIAAGLAPTARVPRLLGHRALTWVGDRSYGWYLFHWPLIVFASASWSATWPRAAAAAASLPLAAVAKRSVEDRFRFDDRYTGRRAVLLAVGCVVIPLVASGVALVAIRSLAVDDLVGAGRRHVDSARCNRRQAEAVPIGSSRCTWTVDHPVGRIVLLGDSHASMWSEAVLGAGNDLGYDVSIATMSGCPTFVGGIARLRDGVLDTTCRDFMADALAEIRELRPDLVLLASATNGLVEPELVDDGRWQLPGGRWVDDVDGRIEIMTDGLAAFTTSLGDAGIRSVVIHDVPYHPFTNAECSWIRYRLSPASCASSRGRSDVEAELSRSRAIETGAAAASERSSTLDPLPWLCDASTCSTYRDGVWSYRDRDHISVAASQGLVPEMRDALRRAGL